MYSFLMMLDGFALVILIALFFLERVQRGRKPSQAPIYVQALNQVANPVTITDTKGRIIFINRAFTELTGYSPEEAIGNTPSVLRSGHHDDAFYSAFWRELNAGNTWHGEMVNRKKDGQLFVDEMTITPLRNAKGRIKYFIAVRQDVTERVDRQRRMIEHAEEQVILPMIDALGRLAQTHVDLAQGAFDLLGSLHECRQQARMVAFVLPPGANAMRMLTTRGEFSREFLDGEAILPLGQCLCGKVAAEGKVLVCEDCFHDVRHENTWSGMQLHGHYVVPVMHQGNVLGVINVYTNAGVQQTPQRLLFLTSFGQRLGAAWAALDEKRGEYRSQAPVVGNPNGLNVSLSASRYS